MVILIFILYNLKVKIIRLHCFMNNKEERCNIMKESDVGNSEHAQGNSIKRANLLNSKVLDQQIKNLQSPRFLGSYHMQKGTNSGNIQSVENLLDGELELKVNKALKNSYLNPFTKALVILMIIFNLLWILITIF